MVVRPRCILHSLRASKGNSKFDKVERPHILVRKKTIANTDDIGHFIMDKIGEVKKNLHSRVFCSRCIRIDKSVSIFLG